MPNHEVRYQTWRDLVQDIGNFISKFRVVYQRSALFSTGKQLSILFIYLFIYTGEPKLRETIHWQTWQSMQQAKIWAFQYHMDRVWLISTEIAGITTESGDGRKHPPVWNKTHSVQCTENEWRYGKRQVNLGIIESYLVKYGVLSLNNENEQVKKVTKCIN